MTNSDVQVQRTYIRYFVDQLEPGGQLVVYQVWRNAESLSAIYGELVPSLPDLQFELHDIANPKLLAMFPASEVHLAAVGLEKRTGKELLRKVLVISRRAGNL